MQGDLRAQVVIKLALAAGSEESTSGSIFSAFENFVISIL